MDPGKRGQETCRIQTRGSESLNRSQDRRREKDTNQQEHWKWPQRKGGVDSVKILDPQHRRRGKIQRERTMRDVMEDTTEQTVERVTKEVVEEIGGEIGRASCRERV